MKIYGNFSFHILLFSFKEEAETKCYECCQKAIEYDAANPEAFQLMASCLLSQQNMEEARKMLEKSLELWQGKDEELPEVSCIFCLAYSQTKWSVPLKIALMNWLFETWTC